jgi:hypothetical protein
MFICDVAWRTNHMRGTGRVTLQCYGIAAETNKEMDNGVLFSQVRANRVVFIHLGTPTIRVGTIGDETLEFNGDALLFVYLRHEGLINHKELGDVV